MKENNKKDKILYAIIAILVVAIIAIGVLMLTQNKAQKDNQKLEGMSIKDGEFSGGMEYKLEIKSTDSTEGTSMSFE